MNEHLKNAEGQLEACADWHQRTGGTLPVKLTCFEARAIVDELKRLREIELLAADMFCE